MESLNGRVALVTCATDAVGRAISTLLASRGCRVGLTSDSAEDLEPLSERVRCMGTMCESRIVNLRVREAAQDAIKSIARDLGPIDFLIHNADVFHTTDMHQPDPGCVREMLEWNCLSGIYSLEAVLPKMLSRGQGHVVARSSLLGLRGCQQAAGYAASVSAWTTYLESLRPALRRRGVYVTTVRTGVPHPHQSEETQVPSLWRAPDPDQVAQRTVRAMRKKKREVFFPPTQSLMARVLRRLPARAFDSYAAQFVPLMLQQEKHTA